MLLERQRTGDLGRLELGENTSVAALMPTTTGDNNTPQQLMEALEMDADGAHWMLTDLRSDLRERLRSINFSFADDQRRSFV
jgi:hypothetical protein